MQMFSAKPIKGIYFLYKGIEIVYVGQSENILMRVGVHIQEKKKNFDTFSYIEVERDLAIIEDSLILKHQPLYNRRLNNYSNLNNYLQRNYINISNDTIDEKLELSGLEKIKFKDKFYYINGKKEDYFKVFL